MRAAQGTAVLLVTSYLVGASATACELEGRIGDDMDRCRHRESEEGGVSSTPLRWWPPTPTYPYRDGYAAMVGRRRQGDRDPLVYTSVYGHRRDGVWKVGTSASSSRTDQARLNHVSTRRDSSDCLPTDLRSSRADGGELRRTLNSTSDAGDRARRRIRLIGYPSHAMTSRLHRRLLDRGHVCELIHPDRLVTETSTRGVVVHPIGGTRPDVVVLTTSTDHVAALHSAAHLESIGIPVLNRPAAILLAADKAQTAVTLARAGVPVPRTTCVASIDAALEHAEHLGYPLVLKAADGAEGNQVRRVQDAVELSQTFEELRASMGQPAGSRVPLVLQELLSRALGHDRRLFVVGAAVQATMGRAARPGEWRSNLSQGAEPLPALATPEEIDVAERAARALGLDLSTVDLMAGPAGPLVMEANAYGDILDVGMTSGLDLVGAMADLVEMRAGARPSETVVARPLPASAHRALTEFCLRRLRRKREELEPATAAAPTVLSR